ncbi:hypothetical protein O9929_11315 [Vibrio lentus]|nr:hypothetical protein [Vibrio lentus]
MSFISNQTGQYSQGDQVKTAVDYEVTPRRYLFWLMKTAHPDEIKARL